jgi:hypothetical protein
MKMGKKAWLTGNLKADGRCNVGKVVGIDKTYEVLCFVSEKQFIDHRQISRYKVAYVDVVTGKGVSKWFHQDDVSFVKPKEENK